MNNRNRMLTVILVALIVGITAGYALALNPTFQTIIQPGSMISPVSQIAFTDSVNYFLKNGNTGAITLASSSAITILSAGLNSTIANHGILFIRSGSWNIGSSNISLKTDAMNFGITWEYGAVLKYTGSSYAIDFHPTSRGGIQNFTFTNPEISASVGGCIHLFFVADFDIYHPNLICKTYGITIESSNTGRVSGGGIIQKSGIIQREAGSIGIWLGPNAKGSPTATEQISIDSMLIRSFEIGIEIGNATSTVNNEGMYIHNIDISSSSIGLLNYNGKSVSVYNNYFEESTTNDIKALMTNGGLSVPLDFSIFNNLFSISITAINIPAGQYVYHLNIYQNEFRGSSLYLGDSIQDGTVDITTTASITLVSSKVKLSFNPNPQTGIVTGISTTNAGNVTGSVTFPVAYPTGLSYKVFVTLSGPSATTSVQTAWVWGRTNTGFSWTVWIITNVAGTVSLEWQATI